MPPTLISSVSRRPVISTRSPAISTRSPVRTGPPTPSPRAVDHDHEFAVLDGQRRPARRVAVEPRDRESGAAVVDGDRGADLAGRVDPADPRVREHVPQPVEDRLVDRLAAERDLRQRELAQHRRPRGTGSAARTSGVPETAVDAVPRGDRPATRPVRPGSTVTTCWPGHGERQRHDLPPGVRARRVRAQPGALRLVAADRGRGWRGCAATRLGRPVLPLVRIHSRPGARRRARRRLAVPPTRRRQRRSPSDASRPASSSSARAAAAISISVPSRGARATAASASAWPSASTATRRRRPASARPRRPAPGRRSPHAVDGTAG